MEHAALDEVHNEILAMLLNSQYIFHASFVVTYFNGITCPETPYEIRHHNCKIRTHFKTLWEIVSSRRLEYILLTMPFRVPSGRCGCCTEDIICGKKESDVNRDFTTDAWRIALCCELPVVDDVKVAIRGLLISGVRRPTFK